MADHETKKRRIGDFFFLAVVLLSVVLVLMEVGSNISSELREQTGTSMEDR
jgi:hypothetical protein